MPDLLSEDDGKKAMFERFLTYRRRMARMCCVQAVYLYEMQHRSGLMEQRGDKDIEGDVAAVCQAVLYFYRYLFLPRLDYGSNKKNKRIDEKYFLDTALRAIRDMPAIDDIISQYLNERWTVARLDSVIRSILRCAVCEILYEPKTEIAVLTSEYTTMSSHFFVGKEIGFINGIIDKIGKTKRANSET